MLKIILSVLTGILFGLTVGVFFVVKIIRRRVRKIADEITADDIENEYKNEIAIYVNECQKSTEKILRKQFKNKDPLLIVKLVRLIKERKKKERLYNEIHEPTDEVIVEEKSENFEEKPWYPFYLMLHSIGSLYEGIEPLAFLQLNEKNVFGIIQKIDSTLLKLLDGIGIDKLKRVRCSFILDTVNILKTMLQPLKKDEIKAVYKTTVQGVMEFNKIKQTISLNPFYHLRVFIKKKISNEMVIEAVKCVIDVVAGEIVNIYSEKQS